MAVRRIEAEPSALVVELDHAALIIIDMQRDFLEPGGFGETLGNDVSLLKAAVAPLRAVLDGRARDRHAGHPHPRRPSARPVRRAAGTRSSAASRRCASAQPGPMGRILVRGEPGHDIIPELYPAAGEPVIDKPGKGAFYQTDLELMLKNREIDTLLVCGVTTEVCVNTTVREANDRGFRCIVLSDCCASYFPGISRGRSRDDQGAGRHLRLGLGVAGRAGGAGFALSSRALPRAPIIEQCPRVQQRIDRAAPFAPSLSASLGIAGRFRDRRAMPLRNSSRPCRSWHTACDIDSWRRHSRPSITARRCCVTIELSRLRHAARDMRLVALATSAAGGV